MLRFFQHLSLPEAATRRCGWRHNRFTGAPSVTAPEPNRQELVAAVSAAIAEELGTDITGIRILSMKKL